MIKTCTQILMMIALCIVTNTKFIVTSLVIFPGTLCYLEVLFQELSELICFSVYYCSHKYDTEAGRAIGWLHFGLFF